MIYTARLLNYKALNNQVTFYKKNYYVDQG